MQKLSDITKCFLNLSWTTCMYFNCSHYNREDKHFVTLFTPAVGQKGQLNNAMNFENKQFQIYFDNIHTDCYVYEGSCDLKKKKIAVVRDRV